MKAVRFHSRGELDQLVEVEGFLAGGVAGQNSASSKPGARLDEPPNSFSITAGEHFCSHG